MRNVIMKHKKKIDKVTNFLLNILIFIFAFILLISIYVGIQTKVMDNNYANFFGYSLFEVQTGSMADEINAGDWIIVKITKDVELNDVITYKHGDEFITHRVIEIYNGTYVTKGDANNAKDNPIDQVDVVGKVSKVLGDLGILRATIFNPAVLIALIVTLFLFNAALGKKKNSKQDEELNKILNIIKEKTKVILDKIVEKYNEIRNKVVENNEKQVKTKEKVVKPVEKTATKAKAEKKLVEKVEKVEEIKPVLQKVTIENDEIEIEEKEEVEEIDDLEKTMYFRMINVDGKQQIEEPKEQIKIVDDEPEVVEDMDKTTFFRMISVNEDEVSNTLNEVADHAVKEEVKEVPKKKVVKKVETKKKVVKKTIKKGKNVIDTLLINKEDELNEIINLFVVNKLYDTKQVIRKTVMKKYIRAKYYNIYDDTDLKYRGKDSVNKIRKAIKVCIDELEKTVDDKAAQDLHFYLNAFNVIAGIENTKDATDNEKVILANYKKEISKYFQWNKNQLEYLAKKILEIQNNYTALVNDVSDKLDTKMFDLIINELSHKNMYAVDIEHNINFSKVYSDYIIDKTYENGIVAEDKVLILITLLLTHLMKEMVETNFNKEYVFDLPATLYKKPRKFKKILRMLEDEYVKSNTIIFIKLDDLTDNLALIRDIKKQGYKVATLLDDEKQFKVKNRRILGVANYIFVDKKNIKLTNLRNYINEDLKPKIIYDDIISKTGGNK